MSVAGVKFIVLYPVALGVQEGLAVGHQDINLTFLAVGAGVGVTSSYFEQNRCSFSNGTV